MIDEEESQNEEQDYKPFTGKSLNRIVAILFVLGIYLIIFLKITILK